MNTVALKQINIIETLSQLPESKLDQVKLYLDELLKDEQKLPPQNKSLIGIWKDAGFEKIVNLEEELQIIRNELQNTILKRAF